MSKKKVHHEEHVDETWLIPYADMLTLLLALFIVMFAMSKVDSAKMAKMSEEFKVIFQGGASVLDNEGVIIPPIETPNAFMSESAIEDDKMHELEKQLEEEIEQSGYADKIDINLNGAGLEISIQDLVLFDSGAANILDGVHPLLVKISYMLHDLDNNIKIVGHSDNVPIKSAKFKSNWELSATRAINVMNFMAQEGGLAPEKFSIQAYGEYKPKYDNTTTEGRAKNRRVEIFIDRKYPMNDSMVN